MSDEELVEALRGWAKAPGRKTLPRREHTEWTAANRITELKAEVAELRNALLVTHGRVGHLLHLFNYYGFGKGQQYAADTRAEIAAALDALLGDK